MVPFKFKFVPAPLPIPDQTKYAPTIVWLAANDNVADEFVCITQGGGGVDQLSCEL
jgi:hypothetical protein